MVTGGARGIGRGIAERLVRRGYAVVVADVDGPAARECATQVGAVEGVELDVRDPDGHRRTAGLAARFAPLAAWFNNAGVGDDGLIGELSDDAVRRLVEVNLLGTLWGMRAATEEFGPAGGDVVNTASLAGLGPVPGYGVYAATKAAIVSVSMSVAAEAPRGVRVHALCPDGVRTAMLDSQTAGGLGAALVHSGGRILTVQETADAAVALLGSRRVVRTLPAWRGGLVRATTLAPSVAMRATAVLAAQGRRAIARER